MSKRIQIVVATISVALLTSAGAVTCGAAEISLRPQAVCSSSVVCLGDVAAIGASDSRRARELAALPLMPSPAPGTQRFLRQREVQDLLAAHGEDVSQLRFTGREQVAIVSAAASDQPADARAEINQSLTRRTARLAGHSPDAGGDQLTKAQASDFREGVTQLIADHLNAASGQARDWRITAELSDRHLRMLQAAATRPTCSGGRAPWTGKQRFVISFATTQGDAVIPLSAEVAFPAPVAVAIRPIGRGDVVTAADVEIQHIDNVPGANDRRFAFDSVEKLIGMEASRPIAAGDVIFNDVVQPPVLVKRGDEVTVVTQGGGIRIRTIARARQEGSHGDLVQVESTNDNRDRYDARVVGLREVAVFTPARPNVAPDATPPVNARLR